MAKKKKPATKNKVVKPSKSTKKAKVEPVEKSVQPEPESSSPKRKSKKSELNDEIDRQEITENGGYIHGFYATTEVAGRIAEQTRLALDHCKNKLFVERLNVPSVINYLEALEQRAIQAERIVNFKPEKKKNKAPKK